MANIDYDRLELIVAGDIHEDHLPEFDIPTIVQKANIETDGPFKGTIKVQSAKFIFWYDPNTYEQINGVGDDGSG